VVRRRSKFATVLDERLDWTERGEGWGGWCRNMKAQRKIAKLKFKVFLKILSLFSHKNAFFLKKYFEILWGRVGERW
jgi:hypothetical protein